MLEIFAFCSAIILTLLFAFWVIELLTGPLDPRG